MNQTKNCNVTQELSAIAQSERVSLQTTFVYRNLSHLKRDISAVPDNLRPDLDQFHEKAAKRPVLNFLWKNQASKKISQIVRQKIGTLIDDYLSAGTHTAVFDGAGMASGIYFYWFQSKSFSTTGKLLIVK